MSKVIERGSNGASKAECDEAKGRFYFSRDSFCVTTDLRALPFAEETMFECSDGKVRAGIFIPYEENNIYRGEKYAFFNQWAVPRNPFTKRKFPNLADETHVMHPYWTAEHEEEMEAYGIKRRAIYSGFMKMLSWQRKTKGRAKDRKEDWL